MEYPLVSIIVPTYNNKNYICDCLDSIMIQLYPCIELIISDDGSDDFNDIDIEIYINKRKNSNIINYKIIHHNINIGTVKNLNNAIFNSEGEYIIGLSGDDCFFDENSVSNVVKAFKNSNALIMTSYRYIYDNSMQKVRGILPKKKHVELLRNQKKLYNQLCKENFISGASTYYSREFFKKYGLFNENYKLIEDYPKYLQIVRRGCQIEFIDKVIIKYRDGGITSSSYSINIKKNQLSKDINKVIYNEILQFPEKISLYTLRLNRYKYEKYNSCGIFEIMKICMKYPEIIIINIMKKSIKKLLDKHK